MINRTIFQKKRTVLIVGLLALLLLATLLWLYADPGGLFGTAVNTSGVIVESSECGARRSDVCLRLDFNHEIVLADTNGFSVDVGYRVQTLVQEDLSRATITNIIATNSGSHAIDSAQNAALETTEEGVAGSVGDAGETNAPTFGENTSHVFLPLLAKG